MDASSTRLVRLVEADHHYLLWLLIGSYALAALVPLPGLWPRSVDVGCLLPTAGQPHISLHSVLLSFLLFNADLGVQPWRLWQLARRPTLGSTACSTASWSPCAGARTKRSSAPGSSHSSRKLTT